jgi:hypothetical protein
MELKEVMDTDTQKSTDFARYTLIRVTDGVVFKAHAEATFKFYSTQNFGTTS